MMPSLNTSWYGIPAFALENDRVHLSCTTAWSEMVLLTGTLLMARLRCCMHAQHLGVMNAASDWQQTHQFIDTCSCCVLLMPMCRMLASQVWPRSLLGSSINSKPQLGQGNVRLWHRHVWRYLDRLGPEGAQLYMWQYWWHY